MLRAVIKRVIGLFKREDDPIILAAINENRGNLWEKIEEFRHQFESLETTVKHGDKNMDEQFPTKHHFDDGLYTRELFIPKGSLVVSFIHKQNHPSFFMKGELSILTDSGEIKRIKAPMQVNTKIGTQRVAYAHEDTVWTCVYRTDAKTREEAEADVYTDDFRKLPKEILTNPLEVTEYTNELWLE